MRSFLFAIFGVIVMAVFLNMSSDALDASAAIGDNLNARYEQINE
jgi:hypothetical protein